MSAIPYCAGFVILYEDETILVVTKKGWHSFPKGKRNKGETDYQCAFRELNEETGIEKEELNILDGIFFDEYSKKGKLSVRYFVAKLKKKRLNFTFDEEELSGVKWVKIDKVKDIEKIKPARINIMNQVKTLIN